MFSACTRVWPTATAPEDSAADRTGFASRLLALVVFAFLFFAAAPEAQAAEDEIPEPGRGQRVRAEPVDRAPRVDGRLDEWAPMERAPVRLEETWQAIPSHRAGYEGPDDARLELACRLHGSTLYLALRHQDQLAYHDPDKLWWESDSIELFLDVGRADGSPPPERFGPGCWQIFLMPHNASLRWGVVWRGGHTHYDDGGLRGVRFAWQRVDANRTTMEMAIPLDNFELASGPATEIGFNVALNDIDDPASGEPSTYLTWNGASELYQRPRRFATLELPARQAPAPLLEATEDGAQLWWVLALLAALLVGFVLTGPAAGWLTNLGPRRKLGILGIVALLAAGVALEGTWSAARAENDVRARLVDVAKAAQPVIEAAAQVGAFDRAPREAARRLLSGERVEARPGVEASAFVPLHAEGGYADGRSRIHRISLAEAREFLLPRPVEAEAITVELMVAREERRSPDGAELGTLTLEGVDGSRSSHTVVHPGGEASPLRIRLPLEDAAPFVRMTWTPAEASYRLILRRVLAHGSDEASRELLLSGVSREGVPILAHPPGLNHGRDIDPGASAAFPLPRARVGADRLWLLLRTADAFPDLLGDAPLVRVTLHYDLGEDVIHELRNGEHVMAEQVPSGIEMPEDHKGRVAFTWTEQGDLYAQRAIPLRLENERRPTSVTLENLGPGGILRVVAATVVATRRTRDDAYIEVVTNDDEPRDTVHAVIDTQAFARHLSPQSGEIEHVARYLDEDGVGGFELRWRAEAPAAAASSRERRRIGLLVCLAMGGLIVVLLAVDLAERFHRLTRRLSFGVMVAALVPLVVTMVLVDRSIGRRVEAEYTERTRSALASIDARLEEATRNTRGVASRMALHMVRTTARRRERELDRLSPLFVEPVLPRGVQGSALVTGATFPTHSVAIGAEGHGLVAPQALAVREPRGTYVTTPWDGALLVASARRGPRDDWIRATVGVRVDDALLARVLGATRRSSQVSVALIDPQGTALARFGPRADDLADALGRMDTGRIPRSDPGTIDILDAVPGTRTVHLVALASLRPASSGAPGPILAVALDRAAIAADLAEERRPLLWLALFSVVLMISVATLVARRVARPVRKLVRVTEAVRRGEFDVDVPPAGRDEVGRLTIAFDQMRRSLQHRVGDLDFLRSAQERMARTLDFGTLAGDVADLFHDRFGAEQTLVLEGSGAGARARVVSARGPGRTFTDRPFNVATEGFLAEAFTHAGPLVLDGAGVAYTGESTIVARLLEKLEAGLAVPLVTGRETIGLVLMRHADADAVPHEEGRRLLEPLAGIAAGALHNARLYQLAALDEQTGLPGTTAFEAALREDIERASAGEGSVTLLRIALDHIEHLTLRRGMELATEVTHASAQALRALVGDRSRLGRLRVDEFGVRLADASPIEARELAERIRERLGAIKIPPEQGGEVAQSTVSIGIARAPEDARSLHFLLDAAGRALAAVRREGGNRIEEVRRVDDGAVETPPFEDGAIFRNERMVRVVDAARRAARSDASVLITGETGTGKEVIATLIHRRSARAERPFVSVNCAAFPETLLESELFGHERGAFTGADRRREGRFELADGGTLFLDEIAEMAPTAQTKLLRVLQERQFTRLGGTQTITVDVRIIAATNRELEALVADSGFREDLYYRLNVIRLELPPLRERREEIPHLVELFLSDQRRRMGHGPKGFTGGAMDILYRHPWPGNVRELKNVVERCAVLTEDEWIGPEHLQLDAGRGATPAPLTPRGAPGDDLNSRQRILLDHLARNGRCTNREYTEMTGTSSRTALRDLQDLMARGLIVREGKRRGAVYRLP